MSCVELPALQQVLAGLHAIGVSADGVYLAVVGHHSKWLGQTPVGECVCAVTLVDHRQARDNPRIRQVRVVAEQLWRKEHALVADRAAGHGNDVEIGRLVTEFFGRQAFCPFASQVEGTFERFSGSSVPVDKHLPDRRFGLTGQIAQTSRFARYVAPAQHLQSVIGNGLLEQFLALTPEVRVFRFEDHCHAVTPPFRKGDAESVGLFCEELVGDLKQDTGSVSGGFVASRRASMLEVQYNLVAQFKDTMAAAAVDVHNRTDAAGVMLAPSLIQEPVCL